MIRPSKNPLHCPFSCRFSLEAIRSCKFVCQKLICLFFRCENRTSFANRIVKGFMTVLIVWAFMVVSCIIFVCILSYCKARILKNTERMNNPQNHMNSAESRSRPRNTIFVVPTTSQVIEMYITQANAAAINNVNRSLSVDSSVRRPPSYGTVIVDVPPTYDQAIQHLATERK